MHTLFQLLPHGTPRKWYVYSMKKVRFSLVHGLFCLNPKLDHQFGSGIFLNLELDPWFRIKRVWFGFRERVNPKLNMNVKGRWCLLT